MMTLSHPPEHAVILAAGLGTRLAWMTRHRPKALMNIQGEPAIVHVIRRLSAQGIRYIVINTHHHAAQLMNFLGKGEAFGVHLDYSQESALLDSGGGVRTAMQYLPKHIPLLVHNADVISDMDIHRLAVHCPEHGAALALVPNPLHHPEGDFACHAHRVSLDGTPRYTFSGVSLWDSKLLENYPKNQSFPLSSVMRDCIHKQYCRGMVHRGQWFDIGRPRDVWRAHKYWRAP